MKLALVNGKIFTGKDTLIEKVIVTEDAMVSAIIEKENIPSGIKTIDLKGMNVAPGFIDLQVNGGGGSFFTTNPTEESISLTYSVHKIHGTTGILPTLASTTYEKMLKAICVVRKCMEKNKYGVMGLHLEGPYISSDVKKGAHNPKYLREVKTAELKELIKEGKDVIKIITVAPELLSDEHLHLLRESGITISAGHSNATYEEAVKGFKGGITKVTHLFNGMSQFLSREPGLVGATLSNKDIWAGIIVDGVHIHYAAVKIAKQLKGNKLILVTDAMPCVGSDVAYSLNDNIKYFYQEDVCISEAGMLAGSSLTMDKAVRNSIEKVGIPLDESLRMASTYPAEAIGLGDKYGRLQAGYYADMVIFNDKLEVNAIVSKGVYEKFVD